MSVQRVREFLKAYGLDDRVREFDVSSATVELAAQAVGVEAARIAKTLSFHLESGCLLVVAAGDARIDNRKFKEAFHTKAKMLSADEALAMTGHAVGGVCPFALPEGVRVCLDESLRRFDAIYPAAGSANSAVKLTCEELQRSTGGEWVDVCKLPE
ncbi:MAG TPA: YbaK/EbsC family protein [Candidatus Pullichristensenella avicola]|nr:YbaK/EbsC family protein [Candidatus Pullichristensenella avicola]